MLQRVRQVDRLDLAFQEIDAELAGLPGEYAPPRGALFVVGRVRPVTSAMIGLRQFDGPVCEMKRLYVRPGARGRGLATQLIAACAGRSAAAPLLARSASTRCQ